MGPTLTTVEEATRVFADPATRTQCKQWHQDGVPLLEMVERLGFGHTITPDLRTAVESLKPGEVAIIRAAFLAEIERAGTSTKASLPVDCKLTQVTGPVKVTAAADKGGRQVAKVEDST